MLSGASVCWRAACTAGASPWMSWSSVAMVPPAAGRSASQLHCALCGESVNVCPLELVIESLLPGSCVLSAPRQHSTPANALRETCRSSSLCSPRARKPRCRLAKSLPAEPACTGSYSLAKQARGPPLALGETPATMAGRAAIVTAAVACVALSGHVARAQVCLHGCVSCYPRPWPPGGCSSSCHPPPLSAVLGLAHPSSCPAAELACRGHLTR